MPEPDWLHRLCYDCWDRLNPDNIADRTVSKGIGEPCCCCGDPSYSGLTMHADPESEDFICDGVHPWEPTTRLVEPPAINDPTDES